jgi:hypothetical protein
MNDRLRTISAATDRHFDTIKPFSASQGPFLLGLIIGIV